MKESDWNYAWNRKNYVLFLTHKEGSLESCARGIGHKRQSQKCCVGRENQADSSTTGHLIGLYVAARLYLSSGYHGSSSWCPSSSNLFLFLSNWAAKPTTACNIF